MKKKPPLKKSIVRWATGWDSNRHQVFGAGVLAKKRKDLQRVLDVLGVDDFSPAKCLKVKITRL